MCSKWKYSMFPHKEIINFGGSCHQNIWSPNWVSSKKSNYRINLWFPSICHMQFGAGTEYCLRWRVRLARARSCVPSGSTLCSDSRILKTSKEILWVFFMLRLKLEFCQITSTWCKVNTRISKRVTEIIMLNVFYLFLQLNWQCLYVHQIAY